MRSTIYVHTARDLGRLIDDTGKTHYYVGNGLFQVELHPIEYVIWKEAARMESVDKWRQIMSEKIKTKTNVSFDRIEKKLLDKKLIHPLQFKNEEDSALVEIFVIRNAFAYGERNGNWVIAPHDNNEKFKLSEEEYEIWVAASSYKSLLEIVAEIGEKRNYTMQQAIQVISEKARKFIRTELWTAEYIAEEEL